MGIELGDEEFEKFFDSLDKDASGTIMYNEFVKNVFDSGSTTIDVGSTKGQASDGNSALRAHTSIFASLEDAFNAADHDGSGVLSMSELKDAVAMSGVKLEPVQLQVLMDQYDQSHDGQISCSEFLNALKGQKAKAMNPNLRPHVKTVRKQYTMKELLQVVRQKMESITKGGGGQARKMFKQFDRDGR